MVFNLLKAATAIQIWIWLKPRILGFAILLVSIFAILIAHSEFLGYVERTENTEYLLISYLLKWGGIAFAILAYSFCSWIATRRARSRRLEMIEREQIGDGFDFLRGKKKLESKTDIE